MEKVILEVQSRQELGKGKVSVLRRKGFIPAVIYAAGGDPQPLKVSTSELLRLAHQRRIEGVVINLEVKGDKKQASRPCLIKEVQYDPVHGDIIHVDFNEISLTAVIKVNVPIVMKGQPLGVKQEGGSLERILWEVEVECLPTNIPEKIEVDVSQLKTGDSMHVKDLVPPEGVKLLNEPEAIVLSVAAPMKEEVPAAVAVEVTEAPQEPEVIKEKKEEPVEDRAGEEKEKKEKKEKKEEKREK